MLIRGGIGRLAITMTAQLAFTASFSGNSAIVARAIATLPGLIAEHQHGTFPTWIQANARAQQLNEVLGLTPLESRFFITHAMLEASQLISDCDSLRKESRQLRQRVKQDTHLELVLVQLDLGTTFASLACGIAPESLKRRFLQNTRKALSNAVLSIGRFDFSSIGSTQIRSGIERLQDMLQEFPSEG